MRVKSRDKTFENSLPSLRETRRRITGSLRTVLTRKRKKSQPGKTAEKAVEGKKRGIARSVSVRGKGCCKTVRGCKSPGSLSSRVLFNLCSQQWSSVFHPVIQQSAGTDEGNTSGNAAERLQIGIRVSNDFAIVVIVVEIIVEIIVPRFGRGALFVRFFSSSACGRDQMTTLYCFGRLRSCLDISPISATSPA